MASAFAMRWATALVGAPAGVSPNAYREKPVPAAAARLVRIKLRRVMLVFMPRSSNILKLRARKQRPQDVPQRLARGILRVLDHPGLVPIDRPTAILVEGQAYDVHRRRNADLARGHFQSHPLAGCGQGAKALTAGRVRFTKRDQVRAPKRALVPTAIVPLQHDLARQSLGIDVNVGEQHIVRSDAQRLSGADEMVLSLLARAALRVRSLAAEDGRVGFRDPFPRLRVAASGRARALRQTVFQPALLDWRFLRLLELGKGAF